MTGVFVLKDGTRTPTVSVRVDSVIYGKDEPGLSDHLYTAELPVAIAMRLAAVESECDLITSGQTIPLVPLPNSLTNSGRISFQRRGV